MKRVITAKRQSESWAGDDDNHLAKAYPRYCGSELIENMAAWSTSEAIEAACRDLSRQLTELLCQAPRSCYRIETGHLKVSLNTSHIYRRVAVDITLIMSDEEGKDE